MKKKEFNKICAINTSHFKYEEIIDTAFDNPYYSLAIKSKNEKVKGRYARKALKECNIKRKDLLFMAKSYLMFGKRS